jgi:DNA-binding ferritin-like protein
MVNALNKNFSPLPAGKYGKSSKRSTRRRHQANEDKSDLEAERIRALGALHNLRSKKTLAAERRQETNFLNYKEKEKWIEDYVERETTVARKQVEDAGTAGKQEPEDI